MASPKSEQKGDEANHSILARSLPLLRAFHLVITTSGGGGGGAKNHDEATDGTFEFGNEVVLRGTNCPRHISQGTVMNFPKTPTNPLLFVVKILQNEQSSRRICRLKTNIFTYHYHTGCLDTISFQNQVNIKQIQHLHFYHYQTIPLS